jgi:outer membrane lipase/esterase
MRKISLLVILMLLMTVNSLYAMKFSNLYVFGDSLSVKKAIVWPEHFIISNTTFSGDLTNRAVSGATSYDVFNQINSYLSSNSIDPDALYVVFAGTNDGSSNVEYIKNSVEALHSAGAKYIMVSNLHDNPKRNTSFIISYNRNLLNGLNNLNANVIQVDTYTLFEEMYDNPSAFGFASYADILSGGLHFSPAAHGIVSDYFSSVIEAGSLVSILPEIALSAVRGHQAGLEHGFLMLEKGSNPGKWASFYDFEFGNSELDKSDYTVSHDSNVFSLYAGLAYSYYSNLDLGLILNLRMMSGDFGKSSGDYDLTSEFLSLFARYTYKKAYLDMVCTYGLFSFDDINREVALGTLTRTESGATDGDDIGFSFKSGILAYDNKGFSVSPYVSFSMHSITVDGYSEDDNHATSMVYFSQERDSNVFSFGTKFDYKSKKVSWADLTYSALIEYQYDTEDDSNTISSGVKTLEGSSFELIGYTPESEAIFVLLGLNAVFQNGWTGNISFKSRTGDDLTENSIFVGFKNSF